MSLYGAPTWQIVTDITDRIGIRTFGVSKMWQPKVWLPNTLDPQLDANFPSPPPVSGGVLLVGQSTTKEGGALKTTWVFEGINGDGKSVTFKGRSNSLDYNFDPGFSQVDIRLLPNFQTILAQYGGSISDGNVVWPATIPASATGLGGFQKQNNAGQTNPMFGVEDYLRLEGTYSFRYASFGPAANSGVGVILESGSLPGNAPSIGDRNWLQAPSPWKRRGPVYDITEVYWLSGPGGWPKPVYGKSSGSGGGGTGDFNINAANSFGFSNSGPGFSDNGI